MPRVDLRQCSACSLVCAFLLAACAGQAPHGPATGATRSALDDVDNGLSLNGLMANGLAQNGLLLNGYHWNGLLLNGATLKQFSINNLSAAQSDIIMRYLVACALPQDHQLSLTDGSTGDVYTWAGALGLAPEWETQPIGGDDANRWVSACLLALANSQARHVLVSLRGAHPALAEQPGEDAFQLATGTFAGNLFSDITDLHTWAPFLPPSAEGYLRTLGRDCALLSNVAQGQSPCSLPIDWNPSDFDCVHVGDVGQDYFANCWGYTQVVTAFVPLDPRQGGANYQIERGPIRIDCGSDVPFVDPTTGVVWSADRGRFASMFVRGATIPITGAAGADTLYQTYVVSDRVAYRFLVPNGAYTVTLKFAELFDSASRSFDVLINGVMMESIDVAALAAQWTAVDRSYFTQVSDGTITISLERRYSEPILSALEILPARW
jgi:hypothetical protein